MGLATALAYTTGMTLGLVPVARRRGISFVAALKIIWIGIAVAIPAGFVAAWPVNWWLLKRNLKACH